MQQLLSIAVGGAVGALLRYATSSGVYALLGRGFPYGTLIVNIVGSVALGVLYALLVERELGTEAVRAGFIIGLLGAFTTFSTFSLETVLLLEEGRIAASILNASASVTVCVLGCWLGLVLARTTT